MKEEMKAGRDEALVQAIKYCAGLSDGTSTHEKEEDELQPGT